MRTSRPPGSPRDVLGNDVTASTTSAGLGIDRLVVLGLACVSVSVACVSVCVALVLDPSDASSQPVTAPPRLAALSGPADERLHPGGVVTGSLVVSNPGTPTSRVTTTAFTSPTSTAAGCRTTGVALAPTLDAPLEVPADGAASFEWTAYMDGTGDHACQGATLTSEVLLDGEPAGTVTLVAGTLAQPPAPTGGLTTGTRAAVHWSTSSAADPGWVVERAVAGTDGWQPACGSSAARPVRALACTDTGLTASTSYAYRVTLRTGHWHMTSRPSAPVRTQDRPSA